MISSLQRNRWSKNILVVKSSKHKKDTRIWLKKSEYVHHWGQRASGRELGGRSIERSSSISPSSLGPLGTLLDHRALDLLLVGLSGVMMWENLSRDCRSKAAPNWFCVSRQRLQRQKTHHLSDFSCDQMWHHFLHLDFFGRLFFFLGWLARFWDDKMTGNTESIWHSLTNDCVALQMREIMHLVAPVRYRLCSMAKQGDDALGSVHLSAG